MTITDDFLESVCNDDLDRYILEVLSKTDLSDYEKIELLVKYLEGVATND